MAGMWKELTFPLSAAMRARASSRARPRAPTSRSGDEVFAGETGGWAELAIAEVGKVAAKPAGLSFEQAAGPRHTRRHRAYEGLVERLQVGPDDTVLVTSASGGVGSIAVQVAVAQGAKVIGVASAANHDFVRGLGAAEVFDYHDAGWPQRVREAAGGGVDALFEAAGGLHR